MDFMDISIIYQINYFAVLGASVIYFLLGSAWFSTFFGTVWVQELEKHNVVIQEPTSIKLLLNMAVTFASNILASFGLAYLVLVTGSATITSGLILGLMVSICFVIPTVATIFAWENRSVKLFLIDVGYPVLGIITACVLLSLWQ